MLCGECVKNGEVESEQLQADCFSQKSEGVVVWCKI